jgi:hypothetical protein
MFRLEPPPIIRNSDCTYSFWYLSNFAATCCDHGWDGIGLSALLRVHTLTTGHSHSDKYQKLYIQYELLMMGGRSTQNM